MASKQVVNKIAVLGGGAFGTAMAHVAALKSTNNVMLYARDPNTVECINKFHINPKKLSQFKLHEQVKATTDFGEALDHADFIISCIPTQQTLPTIKQYRNVIPTDKPWVSCAKGMIVETEQFVSQALHDEFGKDFQYFALSGPSFADEIMKGYPTLLELAGKNGEAKINIMECLHHDQLRVYSQQDVLGVEIAGAMKNVVSIGAGIIVGYGFGLNTVTGFVVKAAQEMQDLASAFGANPNTFFGLAGIGDLILTSFGSASRNRTFGERFGKGENLQQILNTSAGVVEGYYTLDAVQRYGELHNIKLPIVNTIHKVVHGQMSVAEAGKHLMLSNPPSQQTALSMVDHFNVVHK